MAILLDVLDGLGAEAPGLAGRLARQLREWARRQDLDAQPAVAARAVAVWSRLHGFVSLEIEGNLASMGLDADALFDREVDALLR